MIRGTVKDALGIIGDIATRLIVPEVRFSPLCFQSGEG